MKKIAVLVTFSILFNFSFSQPIEGPHAICGNIYLGNGASISNFTMIAINLNRGDIIENERIYKNSNYYQFDVGKPGPSWKDGDTVRIIVNSTYNNVLFEGIKEFKITKDSPYQKIDVYLYPPPPSSPSLIGIKKGYIKRSYNFNVSSSDPNNFKISYGIDWDGDETIDEWSPLIDSGKIFSAENSWDTEGKYTLKIVAKNEYEASSFSYFFIEIYSQPYIHILYPKGGETLRGKIKILWNTTYEKVTIEYGDDTFWDTIASINNSGEYEWDTTKCKDGKYKIRIIANENDFMSEEISDYFYIKNDKKIPSPSFFIICIILAILIMIKKKFHIS
ncbi:MAG: hypothetical protein QXE46_04225 [Candidatus Thermoplasmatota archaeon]